MLASLPISTLLLGFLSLPVEGKIINVDLLKIQEGMLPFADQRVNVGDTIIWHWHYDSVTEVDQPKRSLNYHPSGTCSTTGKLEIQHPSDGPGIYTFSEADAGKSMLFSFDSLGRYCELGMYANINVNVRHAESSVRRIASLDSETLSVAPSPRPLFSLVASPTKQPTDEPTSTPTRKDTPKPTLQVTPSPTLGSTPVPTVGSTPVPTVGSTPVPTVGSTPVPTVGSTPVPTPLPTVGATSSPTPAPTIGSMSAPTPIPTLELTPAPSRPLPIQSTPPPTPAPTLESILPPVRAPPSLGPTPVPTRTPESLSAQEIMSDPTLEPSTDTTLVPTSSRSPVPTVAQPLKTTPQPTFAPMLAASQTKTPSPNAPIFLMKPRKTSLPTSSPTLMPSPSATSTPPSSPTLAPTSSPTLAPTVSPTLAPTPSPTPVPTPSPTPEPTVSPTPEPTSIPTSRTTPTPTPTLSPTPEPTSNPTSSPTSSAATLSIESPLTDSPTKRPTPQPTPRPTSRPTASMTQERTVLPTFGPTSQPTMGSISLTMSESTLGPSPTPSIAAAPSLPNALPSLSIQPSLEPSGRPLVSLPLHGILYDGFKGREQSDPPTTAPVMNETETTTANNTVDFVGTLTFSIVIQNGNLDPIPFSRYAPRLIESVNDLAVDVASNLEKSLVDRQQRHFRRHRKLQNSHNVSYEEYQHRRLEFLHVDLPGSIVEVQPLEFTSNPQISACPVASHNISADRCEKIKASIGLVVDEKYDVELIQQSFQSGLDAGVVSGRLQQYLTSTYPKSRVQIISGDVIKDTGENDNAKTGDVNPATSEEGNLGVFSQMPAKIPVGIAIAIICAIFLAIIVCRITRQQKLHPDVTKSSMSHSKDNDSVNTKIITTQTGLEHGCQDEKVEAGDPDNWSYLSHYSYSGKPRVVLVSPDQGDCAAPLDDTLSYVSAEECQQTPSRENFVASRRSSGDGDDSVISGKSGNNCSSLGSMSTAGFMSGNQVVDLQSGRFKDYTPGIAEFDDLEAALEAAIHAGDWETVGATAAALAGHHNGTLSGHPTIVSWDEESRDCSARGNIWKDVIDATKAAELDQMIEQGNWAAIIDAAAKYESETKEGSDAGTCSDSIIL